MTEDNKAPGGVASVTYKDVIDFFQQRTAGPCPVCQHTKWAVSGVFGTDIKMSWGLVAMNLSIPTTVPAGTPVVYAECKKCAFLRMHDLVAISKWLEKGKPEFKDDE